MRPSWEERGKWLRRKVEKLRPEPNETRGELGPGRVETNAETNRNFRAGAEWTAVAGSYNMWKNFP